MERIEAVKIYGRLLSHKKYKEWREKIIKENNSVCVNCGVLWDCQLHHIQKLIEIISKNDLTFEKALESDLVWDKKNVKVLCSYCHQIEHGMKELITHTEKISNNGRMSDCF